VICYLNFIITETRTLTPSVFDNILSEKCHQGPNSESNR
jgi:hypothetical protein